MLPRRNSPDSRDSPRFTFSSRRTNLHQPPHLRRPEIRRADAVRRPTGWPHLPDRHGAHVAPQEPHHLLGLPACCRASTLFFIAHRSALPQGGDSSARRLPRFRPLNLPAVTPWKLRGRFMGSGRTIRAWGGETASVCWLPTPREPLMPPDGNSRGCVGHLGNTRPCLALRSARCPRPGRCRCHGLRRSRRQTAARPPSCPRWFSS